MRRRTGAIHAVGTLLSMTVRPVQSFLFAHTPSVVVYDCR